MKQEAKIAVGASYTTGFLCWWVHLVFDFVEGINIIGNVNNYAHCMRCSTLSQCINLNPGVCRCLIMRMTVRSRASWIRQGRFILGNIKCEIKWVTIIKWRMKEWWEWWCRECLGYVEECECGREMHKKGR